MWIFRSTPPDGLLDHVEDIRVNLIWCPAVAVSIGTWLITVQEDYRPPSLRVIYNRPIFLTERRLLNAIRNRGLQFINRLADITTIEVYGYRKEDDRRHGLKSQAVSAYVSGRPELSPKINPDAVGALFGSAPTLVTELVNYADTVVADLGHIRRDFPKESLEFATIRARREMRRLHPELSIDAINQLGRFFSYQSR